MQTYRIQDWVFRDAIGKYDIDLGDSNAPCLTLSDFNHLPDITLDYGSDCGSLKLRERIAAVYRRLPSEIGIAHGSQEALYLLYQTLLNPGDHIIACSPGWQQSWEAPRARGCEVSIVPYRENFDFDVDAIAKAIRSNTRALIINTPCNPTGRSMCKAVRVLLLDLVEKHNLYLIADEEYLVHLDQSFAHEDFRAISVSSLSKVYGAPGLRIGWICASEQIINKAMAYKHLTTISNSPLCEAIGMNILDRREFHLAKYKQLLYDGLKELRIWVIQHAEFVELIDPEDTPFAWIKWKGGISSLNFCRKVLDQTRVLLMPAEVFGEKKGIRITFARDIAQLRQGLSLIASCFEQSAKVRA